MSGVPPASRHRYTAEGLARISRTFESAHPKDILRWAFREFSPDVTIASSFGAEDVALLHMALELDPRVRVFTLNTGLLFPETLELIARFERECGLQVVEFSPDLSLEEQDRIYGPDLYSRDPDLCCRLRKVNPLERALDGYAAWVTGLRREQSPTRKNIAIVSLDRRGMVKVSPLATWTHRDLWTYITSENVPYNPMHDRGYLSIGCRPCTTPVSEGEDERSGRWRGTSKKECGIHL